jgi:hypothetical protein
MSQTKPMQQALNQKFIAAYNKYFAKKTTITVDETQYTPAQVTSTVQGLVDTETDVVTTRGQYAQAVAKAKAAAAQAKPIYDGAKQAVLLQYGSNPAVLSEFGLVPKKQPGPKDVATKQAALIQAQATREARHTMGSRQKAKIKGVVALASSDAAVSTPAVTPSATVTTGTAPLAAMASGALASTVTPQGSTGH